MLKILTHPIIETKLTKMRDENTPHHIFRTLLEEISSLMVYEILRDYKTKSLLVHTLTKSVYNGQQLDEKIVLVPILRAGLGMLQGILSLVPEAHVGHIGLYREETTFEIKTYYFKLPTVKKSSKILILDPMLATGHSIIKAIDFVKKEGFSDISLVNLVAAPEGIKAVEAKHPDVNIYVAAVDSHLNDKKYIVPGLGDAGDRIFGTK
ncbi:uracil phosphoribosyltransferase [Mesomycoplasma hyorhinis]|uniref:Uracil phosphoribosyltransferase n=3 Tax=Mesomycoplasma hyorhinis TaxID=2100 RepID=A0ABD6IEK9_MESHY|nr:uracil phosphoribosyltransferase [Mesomycoplasma hyorhinis]ADM22019.1 Uracil phosphoribosyltransferase [Mesomycoplasma hyorhinis HUB-1]AEC46132.1 uracil phosphoribosyltransferase [Mesomycoplasma hyorhinis MCLD]AEX14343.1 uracil phosphoribosyltransferase [Mesomycoplasma hyorhinis GDL-1]AFX74553.1 Uracil phosphoribosyltransferase [Mesomycoplasma hyorhinis SK76]AHA41361.1 uracil phosphoribosyltransferase [Mesomycoplasma hyorhinis DBS 1050]TRM82902.1 uracil phosphoribosyltransferase [Sulfolobu